MEKRVKILEQSELTVRQYTDKKTKEVKAISTVTFRMTDGLDTFVAEMNGERAVNCPRFDLNCEYNVQCSMMAREWKTQEGNRVQSTTIYVDRINAI